MKTIKNQLIRRNHTALVIVAVVTAVNLFPILRAAPTTSSCATPVIEHGVNDTTGVALVEVYDLDAGNTSFLGNISTRGLVQTGDDVMIGGFVVQGTGAK